MFPTIAGHTTIGTINPNYSLASEICNLSAQVSIAVMFLVVNKLLYSGERHSARAK
jgi:hypothetical protein